MLLRVWIGCPACGLRDCRTGPASTYGSVFLPARFHQSLVNSASRLSDSYSRALNILNCASGVAAVSRSTSACNRTIVCCKAAMAVVMPSMSNSTMTDLQRVLGLGQLGHDRGRGQPRLHVLNDLCL